MKRILILLTAIAATAGAVYGQGTVLFSNRQTGATPPIDAKILLPGGTTGVTTGFTAELLVGAKGSTEAQLKSVSTTTFNTTTAAAAGYLVNATVTLPAGLTGDGLVGLVRVYDGTSYAAAKTAFGKSSLLTFSAPEPPSVPGVLTGLTGFTLTAVSTAPVPEPSTLALGILGVGALLLRRRKA